MIFDIRVAGTSFRQPTVLSLKENDPCLLVLEPGNTSDPKAIRVDTADGRPMGYIPRGSDLADAIHAGVCVRAFVKSTAKAGSSDNWGVILRLELPEIDPGANSES